MLSLFRNLFARRRSTGRAAAMPVRKPRRGFRPMLEALEDRRLLSASVFVVPTTQAADATHFYDLQAAINAAGPGGTVTIEPGSASVTAADVNVANLTIQGDANVAPSALPSVFINLDSGASGAVLKHLNLSGAALNNSNLSNILVTDSLVTGTIYTAALVTSDNAISITNNTFTGSTDDSTLGSSSLSVITLDSSSSDTISANTFNVPNTNTPPLSSTAIVTLLSVTNSTIAGNTLTGAGSDYQEGIYLRDGSSDTITGNTINLAPTSGTLHTIALDIAYSAAAASTVTVSSNRLNTNGVGIGLNINATSNTDANVQVDVFGNDFHNDAIGVLYTGTGGTTIGSDLGGGALGSTGNNNFRGFRTTGTATSGAIVLTGVGAGATLQAQDNLFANGITPSNVVFAATGTINLSGPVTGTSAFVQATYLDLLGRSAASSEVSYWSGVHSGSGGQPAVITGILTSQEGLNYLVNNLYLEFLGRPADSMGLSYWTGVLKSGGTLESVEAGILTSQEFLTHANGSNYIQDLYLVLLNRTASASELAYWQGVLNGTTNGAYAAAMGILTSNEYRMDFAQSIYERDLHRTASTSELSYWANATPSLPQLEQQFAQGNFSLQLGLLGIEEGILSSTEFYNDG